MEIILKLFLFSIFFLLMGIAGYKAYRFLNDKIRGSESWGKLLGFTFLLIVANILLFFGGLYLLIEVYAFLGG